MDSVIAKLDNSVFGMLTGQAPRILICQVSEEDISFINSLRPDFVCLKDDTLKKELCPVIQVIGSPDDLPVISGADDPRALKIDAGVGPDEAVSLIRKTRPDTVILEIEKHDEKEHERMREVIKRIRASHSEMID